MLNVAGLLTMVAIPLGDWISKSKREDYQTAVQIDIGLAANHVPHIALFDENGERVGQHTSKKFRPKKKWPWITAGTAQTFYIDQDQHEPRYQDANSEYLQLSMWSEEAICLSFIYLSNTVTSYSWYEDMGRTCDADWFSSDMKVGNANDKPNCVWLDGNHSNGVRFTALSLHMTGFASPGLGEQYIREKRTLCRSKARMSFLEISTS